MGVKSRFRIGSAFAVGLVLVLGLIATPSSAADNIGCSFQAPATIGPADLVGPISDPGLPPPPPMVPDPIFLANFLVESGTAGCFQIFVCSPSCQVDMFYGFSGTGLIAGEVEIQFLSSPMPTPPPPTRVTCGPSVATLVTGGCGGQFSVTLSTPGFYSLSCRAHGVVAVLVSGNCQDF